MAELAPDEVQVIASGKFLRLVRRGRWEYAERTGLIAAAFIGAITPDECLLVTEEFRVPLNAWVIGCPAGLIGDEAGAEQEGLGLAVRRELQEEAGYDAKSVRLMSAGPTSPGLTNETISIVLAEQLERTGAGGGLPSEQIRVHEVPLATIDAWLQQREREGRLIDPKLYAVLYFVLTRRASAP